MEVHFYKHIIWEWHSEKIVVLVTLHLFACHGVVIINKPCPRDHKQATVGVPG